MKFCNVFTPSSLLFYSICFRDTDRITYFKAFSSICQCKSIKNQIHPYVNRQQRDRIFFRPGKCLLSSPLTKTPQILQHYVTLSNVIFQEPKLRISQLHAVFQTEHSDLFCLPPFTVLVGYIPQQL